MTNRGTADKLRVALCLKKRFTYLAPIIDSHVML